jgi:glyoxylase-like metal-dependent hydrolase (beta-lactamase superfamily II)
VADYTITAIESMPFGENSYLIWRHGQSEALVIDPGFDPRSILEVLDRHGLGLAAILNTHGHADHIAGNEAMKEAFPAAPLIIGNHEVDLLHDPQANLSALFDLPVLSPDADRLVEDEDQLEVAGWTFRVREIPGHSPGSVVFICEQFAPAFVFAGDVLLAGSIGRTDLGVGGNLRQLLAGIRSKLLALPDETLIYPGHGPATTIGAERRSNPFVGERAGFPGLR